MKNLLALLALFSLVVFTSCDEDDSPTDLDAPEVTAPAAQSVTVGESLDLTFNYTADAGFKSSQVVATGGTATVKTDGTAGEESGTVVVTFTAGTTPGPASAILTVTDNEDDTDDATAVLTVSASAVPTISGIPASASVLRGQSISDVANVTATIEAEDGLASFEVEVDGEVVNTITYTGETSATVPVDYQTTLADGGKVITIIFSVEDADGDLASFTHSLTVTNPPQVVLTNETDGIASFEGYDATTSTLTLDSENEYVLDGFVFVNDGQTLEIEAGTVIKGLPGQGSDASALIIAKGGKIMAMGTASAPIIFTGVADDLQGSIAADANSTWGGLIILGDGINNANSQSPANVLAIEGLPAGDARAQHGGGNVADDDSGTLMYVSVRHGGSVIGADNEINGISFGSVGRGTTVKNIEVFSNFDDGIEMFGGNVNIEGLVLAYIGDDAIDIDNGYNGSIQKGIVWTTRSTMETNDPTGAELDGATGDDESTTGTPFATPQLVNITWRYDEDVTTGRELTQALHLRDNFGGSILNSIVVGYDAPLQIEETSKSSSSWDLYVAGTLKIENNIFYNINGVTAGASFGDAVNVVKSGDLPSDADVNAFVTYLTDNNAVSDPSLGSGTAALTPSATVNTDLFDVTTLEANLDLEVLNYKGGVDPTAADPFFKGWTKAWEVLSGN
ncbi:MAG: hypothetical protein KI790_06090 [Cyclobacteriaceae bacterium]|nr:hypothetical protein [Cyclobacteriaceae bacterium HetDA_MAG_MS6]